VSGAADPTPSSRLDAIEALVGELRKEVSELRQQASASAEAETRSRLGLAEGERRTVTVLFADVSGFTTLAERLDPEDCNAIMRETLGAIAQAVTDEGGHVEKFIGDAVCALFGAPIAYEDEPQRAARAALRMHRVLEELAQRRPNLPALTVHIGINTGPVIAGGVGDGSQFGVMGDTINTAARLMDAAESGQTFVSAATARRLRRGFELADAGTLKLKGKADQIVTFELVAPREEEAPPPKLLAPFLGRERELSVITTERRGATVVVADAGMGKSRFFDEAEKALESEATVLRSTVIGFDSAPLDLAAHAFRPLIEAMPEGPARDICWTLIDGDPEHFHGDLPGELLALLQAEAQRRRIVALLDGVEVTDASSAALIRFLLPATADLDVHWVLGTRPGSPLANTLASTSPVHRQLILEPIGIDATARILMALLPGAIDEATALALAPRVAGNPEFCAEIAQAFVEEGLVIEDGDGWRAVGDVSTLVVPGTLKEMVEARVESLDSSARQVIQAAAVIGGRFEAKVLESVVPVAGSVESALADLAAADLVRPPASSSSKWMFRAPIAQEVVYDSILKRRRPEMHLRVAEAKLALAEDPADVAETLAFHFSAAGDTERAAAHLGVAARRALLSHGYAAAAELATRSFALANARPPALLGLRAKARLLAGDISGAVRDVDDILVVEAEARALHHATWVLFAAEHMGTEVTAERVLALTDHPYAPAATAAVRTAAAAMTGTVPESVGVEASGPTEPHVLLADGLLALWRGEGERAFEVLRSSHEVAAATDHPLIAVLADEAQTEAVIAIGDAERAATMVRSLDALAREREDAAGLNRVKVLEAEAALLTRDDRSAGGVAQSVLASPAASTTTRARALSVLARAHAIAGNSDEARRLATAAEAAAEGLWLGWRIRQSSAVL
jgi:class 3 adenylate cyclase